MNEQNLYRELLAWLRSHHPLVLAQWERDRKQRESQIGSGKPALRAPSGRAGSALDQLSPDASVSDVTSAIQRELESLGISGGTPGVTPDGAPCIHLIKKGIYGRSYEESVTLARLRDAGYRRHLRQVFG
jgi:hypothetical protein